MGEAKHVVERFYGYFAAGDLDKAAGCFDPNALATDPSVGTMTVEQYRSMGADLKTGLPDSRMVVDRMFEVGPNVVVEGRFVGTHTGPLSTPLGDKIPATNNSVDLPFCAVFKCRDGRIVDTRAYYDQVAMMNQLGFINLPQRVGGPPPPEAYWS
jgi:ketosteroid isomerase-like protein